MGALTDWLKVSVGRNSCHAIKTDGTLWAWGGAASGQLGNGTVVNNSSPIQIGSKTNWTYVSNANNNCFAIDTDGKLYSWGFANFGITGHGNTTTLSVPTQVGGLTTWAQVSGGRYNTIARKTDGTIWAWGRGAYGTIGQSDAVDHQSPVQVGSLTTWANIFCNFRTAVGVTTSGTLFAWGDNDSGEVGVGSKAIEAHSSPVQVGSLTNWSSSRGSTKSIFALKTDKTAWAWGDNHAGTLGQGTAGATDGSSPVQIGSDTNWVRLGGNFFGSVAWGLTE